jgi:thiosulfate dehydrogenase
VRRGALVKVLTLALAMAMTMAGCGVTERQEPLSARGEALARNPNTVRTNRPCFACTTCHAARPQDAQDRVLPGAPLQGAFRRPSFWNGETLHLREAVERCWVTFLLGDASDLDGPTGEALSAWLESLSPPGSTEGTAAVRFSWPATVRNLDAGGERASGQRVWRRACQGCHGDVNTGAGRLACGSVLPEEIMAAHRDDALPPTISEGRAQYYRVLAIEKVRHGSFLGYAGRMPPFSTELLSDNELRDLLLYMGLP